MSVFSWSGAIQFGLVSIPVKAKAAISTRGTGFKMLHRDCGSPMHQSYFCEEGHDGLKREDSAQGWNGRFIDTDYVASLKAEKSKVLEITATVPIEQIDPTLYEKSYILEPDEVGAKAYTLFAKALAQADRVAVGKVALGGYSEQLVVIRPRESGRYLGMETLYWWSDLRLGGEGKAEKAIERVVVTEAELGLAKQLIASLADDFDHSAYVDEYRSKLAVYLDELDSGEAPEVMPVKPVEVVPSDDLLTALRASLLVKEPVAT